MIYNIIVIIIIKIKMIITIMNGLLTFFLSSFTSPETYNNNKCKLILPIKFLCRIILSSHFFFLMI